MSTSSKFTKLIAAVATASVLPFVFATPAHAATWAGAVQLSDPRPNATSVAYTNTITANATTTANAVKCLIIEFDAAADGTGGIPTGVGALAGATLTGTFTTANVLSAFTKDSSAAATGILKFTHATGGTGTNGTIILSGVTNGSNADDDFYIRYSTFNNTDCASSAQDTFISANIFTNATTATINIQQSLSYTITAIGAASTCNGVTTTDASTSTAFSMTPTLAANKVAGQRHDIATNATGGYTLYGRATALPTYSSSDIDALATATYASPLAFSAVGTEAWGFSTNDATLAGGTGNRFTSGGAKWAPVATSTPGNAVADAAAPVSGAGGQTEVCYQVGMSTSTAAGTYTATLIYTATGNF